MLASNHLLSVHCYAHLLSFFCIDKGAGPHRLATHTHTHTAAEAAAGPQEQPHTDEIFPVSIHCTNLSVVYCGPSLPAILSMICSYLAVLHVSRRVCNRGRIRVHRCSCGISPKKNVDMSSAAMRHASQWFAAQKAVWELTAACATAPAVLLCPALAWGPTHVAGCVGIINLGLLLLLSWRNHAKFVRYKSISDKHSCWLQLQHPPHLLDLICC